MLGDLHVHSRFTDGRLTIPGLVDYFGRRGFGVIAVTDHLAEERTLIGQVARFIGHTLTRETFPVYLDTIRREARRALEWCGTVFLPGIEVSKIHALNSRSAHILGIGVSGWVCPDGDVGSIAEALRAQGTLAIAAQPVWTRRIDKQTFYLWNRREALNCTFDAWEAASGPYLYKQVLASGLPVVASSDFHRPRHLDSWETVLRCERTPAALLQAVRDQELDLQFYCPGGVRLQTGSRPSIYGLARQISR